MLDSFLNTTLLYSLALTLLHFLWQGCLVALVLKCTLSFISSQKAHLRYLASSLAMLANLLLPLFTFIYIYQPNSLQKMHGLEFLTAEGTGLGLSAEMSHVWSNNLLEYTGYLSVSWLVVVSFLLAKLILELYNVHQLPKQGIIPTSNHLMARFLVLSQQLKVTSKPHLLISLKVKVPMAIGWLKPVVIIPASMLSGLSAAQLDMLILHELAHIRRHDYLVNLVQTVVETLLFFHPSVHWIAKIMRNEREFCSDDIAVAHCGNPVAYAHTLADTASHCKKHRMHTIPTVAMAASGGDLKQRVLRLVDQHHCVADNHFAKWLASVALVLMLGVVAISQLQQLPKVDFTAENFSFIPASSAPFKPSVSTVDSAEQLSATNLAKNLLEQEQTKFEEQMTPQRVSEAKYDVTPKFSNDHSIRVVNSAPQNINEPDLLAEKPVKVFASNTALLNQPTVSAADATNEGNTSSTANDLLALNTQSSVEKAFAETDSANKSSLVNNPYTQQITALSTAANYQEVHTQTDLPKPTNNNVTHFNFNRAADLSKPTIERPVFVKAKLVKSTDPKYPSAAKRRGIEIDILVNFTIDSDGRVDNLSFERKNKTSYFKSSVKNAMAKWRFVPAQENGQAVESKMSKIFSFSLTH